MEYLGTNIRRIRETKNLSHEYVATQIGIDENLLLKIEKNETPISEEMLQLIAEALSTSIEKIRQINDSIVFNIHQGSHSYAGHTLTVNNYSIDSHIIKLYEDKIELLKDKINYLESQIHL